MQVPLDPFVTLGLMTMACAGMGWLVGPSLGSQVFYLMNRRYKTQMMEKESEFFTRVKKNRVDPSNSSAGNPGTFAFVVLTPVNLTNDYMQCPTFTARRSRASLATGGGSRTNGRLTERRLRPLYKHGQVWRIVGVKEGTGQENWNARCRGGISSATTWFADAQQSSMSCHVLTVQLPFCPNDKHFFIYISLFQFIADLNFS